MFENNKTLQKLYSTKPSKLKDSEDLPRNLVNVWLEEFFDTNLDIEELNTELYQKDEHGDFTPESKYNFNKKFRVSLEQCNAWSEEIKKLVKKKFRISNYALNKDWAFIYLSCAPPSDFGI